MKLTIRFRHLPADPTLRDQLARRVHFALGRLDGEVRSVELTINDVNGPRGGLGLQCRVLIRGPRLRAIVVEQVGVEVLPTVAELVDRAATAAVRAIERRRLFASPLAVS